MSLTLLKAAEKDYVKYMTTGNLTNAERGRLLDAAEKIYTHKKVQIKGYRILVQKARNERIKQLLIRISDEEEKHAQFWSEMINELGTQPEGKARTYLRDRKVGLMMSILGTKGFFEWAVMGEEEGIEDLANRAERIRDTATSEIWSRFAADERMHLERMKTEVLGMEAWEIRGGGGVRDMIFGANDGLVSTLAFVAGVAGAITDSQIVLLSGIAELFAGTISMAAGAYQSSKSEVEVLERETQMKVSKKGMTHEEERDELVKFYQREGFNKEEAEAVVNRMIAQKELPTQTGVLEELGLAPKELGNPVRAGVLCGASFGLAAIVPILPFAFHVGSWEALIASIIATVITLFGVGAMKTIFSRKNWVRSGMEMTVIGASAAAITYAIGTLFSMII